MNYAGLFKLLLPEAIVVLAVLAVLLVDLTWGRFLVHAVRQRLCATVTLLGCAASLGALCVIPLNGNVLQGLWVVGPLSQMIKVFLLLLAAVAALVALEADFTEHVGEYFALLLLATTGFMMLVSTQDILMIFVALELASLSLYLLAAFAKDSARSLEAALKYFLFGGISAGFMLFGLSLLYGLTGETKLGLIALKLQGAGPDPLLMASLVMMTIGLGFKVAAVPLHLWAPDVYQAAPASSATLIASSSKVASFVLLSVVMVVGFAGLEGSGAWRKFASGWIPLLSILAALSIALGNLVAIVQSSVRRLLAYSAIAHAGYALVGVLAANGAGLASVVYYTITYALTVAGAFAVVAVVAGETGSDDLSAFRGLSQRAPVLSLCMLVFMLSLAGIPPLAGFFGKFYVFAAVLTSGAAGLGLLWLVIFAIAMSAVSLYYYLQVLKQIFVQEYPESAPRLAPLWTTQIVAVLLALAVLLLGVAPNLLLSKLPVTLTAAGF